MTEMNGHDRLITPARVTILKRRLSWKQAAGLQFAISALMWGLIVIAVTAVL